VDPGLVIAGAVSGFLVGLTGMGGGALTTPLLILVFGVRPVVAVGSDLVFAAATKFVGAATHLRQGTVDLRVGGWIAAGAVPAALAGTWLVARQTDADVFVRRWLGIVLVAVAVAVLLRQLVRRPARPSRHRWPVTLGLGVVVGFGVGVTSVGSGTLVMAVLLLAYRVLPAGRAVGTDVFQGFLLSTVAGAAHWGAGHVDPSLVTSLLVGSIPAAWVGSRLSARTPDRVLRPILAAVLLAGGLRMI
jgi:hypothetical protein